jgi:phospholipid transport system substrate-binding protein
MIYDASIEGVSLVNNYRQQFDSVILSSSYQALVEKLKEKAVKN